MFLAQTAEFCGGGQPKLECPGFHLLPGLAYLREATEAQ